MEKKFKTLPTTWDDVPLNIGRKIFSIDTSGMTDNVYLEEIIKCFDIDIKNLKIDDINFYKTKIIQLLTSKPKETLETEFIINSKRYKLITDLKNLTFGEFLDLELLLAQEHNNIWDVIHQLLGVLLREEVKVKSTLFSKPVFKILEHDSNKVIENSKLFDRVLSINDVYGFATFFC